MGVSIAPIESSVELMMPWRPEDHDPGKGADDDTRQERQQHDEDDKRLGARSDPVVEPRDRKAQHEAQGGHFRAEQQRRAQYAQAEWIGQEVDILADAPDDPGRIVVQRQNEQLHQWRDEEHQEEQSQRCGQPYSV